eukprot:TRINITY_DN115_c0_g5_i1.p1 TRINITY_DN115_c0_g5~~TRINITY_DN115_c0_g5_i1.p1  ORF type:complete len:182 (-),score=26.09 TRINITY_DN115_c0_g5_i1:763-1308(-)
MTSDPRHLKRKMSRDESPTAKESSVNPAHGFDELERKRSSLQHQHQQPGQQFHHGHTASMPHSSLPTHTQLSPMCYQGGKRHRATEQQWEHHATLTQNTPVLIRWPTGMESWGRIISIAQAESPIQSCVPMDWESHKLYKVQVLNRHLVCQSKRQTLYAWWDGWSVDSELEFPILSAVSSE